MATDRSVKYCFTMVKAIHKWSFFGLFRFGDKILVELQVCCDYYGRISWGVIEGPMNVNYRKMFKRDFKRAEKKVMGMWNEGRRTTRTSKKIIPFFDNGALVPKEVEVMIQHRPYEKQKTVEYNPDSY
jgi:hypothetical protein